MDCTAWTDNLGSREAERLLKKIGQTLGFELKHAVTAVREDLHAWSRYLQEDVHAWWYETSWADGKHLETSEAVCFPDSCGGFRGYAFAKTSGLLQAVLQTRIFMVNIHRDSKRRWQECCFALNPVFNAKSLEELEITLDLLGRKERRAAENGC